MGLYTETIDVRNRGDILEQGSVIGFAVLGLFQKPLHIPPADRLQQDRDGKKEEVDSKARRRAVFDWIWQQSVDLGQGDQNAAQDATSRNDHVDPVAGNQPTCEHNYQIPNKYGSRNSTC